MRVKTIVTALTAGMIVSGSAMAASSDVDAKIANLQQQIQQLQAQVNGGSSSSSMSSKSNANTGGVSFVKYDADYSEQMLNNQDSGVDRELAILKSRQSGQLTPNSIYLGGKGELQAQFRRLNNVSEGNVGGAGTEVESSNSTAIELPYANVIFTSTIGDWVTGYANMAVLNPVTNDVVMPDAYFVVGNLDKAPVYTWGGVKTVDFGDFSMVNTYIPGITRAAFLASGGQFGVGFHNYGVTATVTLLNGNANGALNTSNPGNQSQVNNFAANVKYEQTLNGKFTYHVGTGYINGTGFRGQNYNTTTGEGDRVGAWTANAGFDVAGFALSTDFVMTTNSVYGLANNSALNPVDQTNSSGSPWQNTNLFSWPWIVGYTSQMTSAFNSGKILKAWDVNSSYSMPLMGHDSVFFFSYSQLYQDNDNNIYQFTAGARTNVIDTLWFGLAYNFAGGKLNYNSLQSSNVVQADVTVYF
ncbi:LbtU family siderophore porin [Thiotrichales bacterium 19S3-7]|nr:LbtU family siderophore porin [Thiotrichales bacterium 19S3-7]MCF6801125.1 LbtU family siderophore porin [Thiotrichales bacterium 19S3-11]